MTPFRVAIAVLAAVLVLTIGGCVVFGIGTSDDDEPVLTEPTETNP